MTEIYERLQGASWFYVVRVFWIVVRLIAVYWMGEQGQVFFYQGF